MIGWMAAVVVTLHPWAVDFSSDVMSDGLYAGIYLMAFFALSRLIDGPRPLLAALFGVLAGTGLLARPEGLGLVVTCLLLLLAKAASECRRDVERRLPWSG